MYSTADLFLSPEKRLSAFGAGIVSEVFSKQGSLRGKRSPGPSTKGAGRGNEGAEAAKNGPEPPTPPIRPHRKKNPPKPVERFVHSLL